MGYNCDLCIAKNLIGNRPGRLCMLYQVDLELDTLEYNCSNSKGEVHGIITSLDDLTHALTQLLELLKAPTVAPVLKFIKLRHSRSGGLCPKSFPRLPLTNNLISRLQLCVGGQNGTELVHLPYKGTILEQPNLFIQAFNVYADEVSKHTQSLRQKAEEKKPSPR